MSNAVEKVAADLPEMYGDRIESPQDITFPKLYLITGLSNMAKDGTAKAGDVVRALNSDDPSPTWLIGEDPRSGEKRDHFDAYVFGRSEFVAIYDEGDVEYMPPGTPLDRSNPKMWRGYRYLLAIPEVDPTLPARLQLVRTAGRPTFQNLNYYLERAKAEGTGLPHVRFSIGTRTSSNGKFTYHILRTEEIARGDDYAVAIEQAQFARTVRDVDEAPEADASEAPAF